MVNFVRKIMPNFLQLSFPCNLIISFRFKRGCEPRGTSTPFRRLHSGDVDLVFPRPLRGGVLGAVTPFPVLVSLTFSSASLAVSFSSPDKSGPIPLAGPARTGEDGMGVARGSRQGQGRSPVPQPQLGEELSVQMSGVVWFPLG